MQEILLTFFDTSYQNLLNTSLNFSSLIFKLFEQFILEFQNIEDICISKIDLNILFQKFDINVRQFEKVIQFIFGPYFSESNNVHLNLLKKVLFDDQDLVNETVLFFLSLDKFAQEQYLSLVDLRKVLVQQLLLNDPVAQFIIVLAQREEDRLYQVLLGFQQNCDSGKYVFDFCDHLWLLTDAQEGVLELVLEKLAQHLERAFLLRFLEHGCDR